MPARSLDLEESIEMDLDLDDVAHIPSTLEHAIKHRVAIAAVLLRLRCELVGEAILAADEIHLP